MLSDVQSFVFVIGCNAEAEGEIDNFEEDERAESGDAPGDGDSDGLVEYLMPVSVDGSGREGGSDGVFEDGVDGAGGEDAGEEDSDGATDAVHAECVEGVVIPEPELDLDYHEVAGDAGDGADEESA